MTKRQQRSLAVGALALLLVLGLGGALIARSRDTNDPVANKLALAADYADNDEFQRALNLIDEVLIEDAQNETARDLRDRVLAAKQAADDAAADADAQRQRELAESLSGLDRPGSAEAEARLQEAQARAREAELEIQRRLAQQAEQEAARREAEARRREAEREEQLARLSAEQRRATEAMQLALNQAYRNLDDGDLIRARAKFDDVLEQRLEDTPTEDELHARSLAGLAQSFLAEDPTNPSNRQRALKLANEALDRDDVWEAHYALGQIYAETERFDDAIDAFSAAARLEPDRVAILYELAQAQFRAREFRSARTSYEGVVRLDPFYRSAYHNLGITNLRLDDQSGALEAFRFSVQTKPNEDRSYFRIGTILLDRNDFAGAIDALDRAITLRQDNANYYSSLATAYYRQGNFPAAEPGFERALALEPDSALHTFNAALVKNELDKNQEALALIQRTLQREARRPQYHYTLGKIQEALGNRDAAIDAHGAAVALDGTYTRSLIELGRILDVNGSHQRALQFLSAAFQQEPGGFEVNNNLGNVYLNLEIYDSAIAHFQTAVGLRPDEAQAHYNLAVAFLGAKDFTGAERSLDSVVKIDADFWPAYHRLGEVFVATDQPTRAREVLERLLQRRPDYQERGQVEQILATL